MKKAFGQQNRRMLGIGPKQTESLWQRRAVNGLNGMFANQRRLLVKRRQQQKSRSRSSGHSAQREKSIRAWRIIGFARVAHCPTTLPYHGHRRLLLRARRERPRSRRAAEERDEFARFRVEHRASSRPGAAGRFTALSARSQ